MRQLVKVYRTGDDYHRYTWDNEQRRSSVLALYRAHRRYFGRRVLDLCCGGGLAGRWPVRPKSGGKALPVAYVEAYRFRGGPVRTPC